MAEQINPFEPWGGMPKLVPQEGAQQEFSMEGFGGLPQDAGGSYFTLSPEAMQMMWAPRQQVTPQPPEVTPPQPY